MIAISIREPWAWAILFAGKRIENRSRAFKHRGPTLLHVPLRPWPDYEAARRFIFERSGLLPPPVEELPRGCIRGAFLLTGVVPPTARADKWHHEGKLGHVLERVTPLPVRRGVLGELGTFRVHITRAERRLLRRAGLLPAHMSAPVSEN